MKNKINIFTPHEKDALLYSLFGDNLELQGIMKKIIEGFEKLDYEKIIQGENDPKSILDLILDEEEKHLPLLNDFYQNGCGYNKKEDLHIRIMIEAGIFYTLCKLLVVRCKYQKAINKLMYAATFPDLPARFTPLYLFRLGSIYIEQGKISEAGDRLFLAAHRCSSFLKSPDTVMTNLDKLISYQFLRVNIIKGNMLEAQKMIEELKKNLKDEENIIFSSQEGYYYRNKREFDKGVEVLEKAYEKYRKDDETKTTFSRSWFNTLYQLAFCYIGKGNMEKANELIMEAFLPLKEFDYRNRGYSEFLQGYIAMRGDESNLDKAMKHFQKAYKYFEKNEDYRNMARSKRDLGVVLFKKKNYYEAIKNFNRSLDYDFRTQLDIGIVRTLLHKIDLRNEQIQYYKSREYLKKIQGIELPRKHYLLKEIEKCKEFLENIDQFNTGIIGESKPIKEIKKEVESYSQIDDPLLIIGLRGAGKKFIARFIHHQSKKEGEFWHIHCPSIPSKFLESEIFGHVKGAFIGASSDKIGLLEKAKKGTVYFDEVCVLPVSVQLQLMKLVNDKTIRPVGSSTEKKVDVRLIFSISGDLDEEMARGNLNGDFYDCMSDFMIRIPQLRERKEDIKKLAEFFYVTECRKMKKEILGITSEALNLMEDYPWFGNVKELKKVIKRCVIKHEDNKPISKDLVFKALDVGIRRRGRVAEDIEVESPVETVFSPRAFSGSRIKDSHRIINEVFKVIQECGPVRKSVLIDYCPDAEKSFHHWINILKDKYQVIEENKMANFKVYVPVSLNVLKQKLRNEELEKDDNNIYSVVES